MSKTGTPPKVTPATVSRYALDPVSKDSLPPLDVRLKQVLSVGQSIFNIDVSLAR